MTIKDTNFWLNEAELKTPIHDEMVLWTFNNFKAILNTINFKEPEIISVHYDSKKDLKILNFKEVINSNIYNKIIEYPLKSSNGFNLGYLDFILKINLEDFKDNNNWYYFDESSRSDNKFDKTCIKLIAFEIKPEVKSIGEVLRQFQNYKSNLPYNSAFILVTKTTGLKEIFESQGFYVYEYNQTKEVENGRGITNN